MIIGTAGHIDHGKTALVRALTGIDTDRLPEEKKRGITIELGYAYTDLSPELRVGFVDVPGHESLVRTMIAGASGIDFGLLVVAADDGVMPQTLEHAQILAELGVRQGWLVLSKADLLSNTDAAKRQALERDIHAMLARHGLAYELCETSVHEPSSIASLKNKITEKLSNLPPRHAPPAQGFRLCIDRVFGLDGVGTVVAGSIVGGSIAIGDMLSLAHAPEKTYRVRSLHIQNQAAEVGKKASPGERVAIGLVGLSKEQVSRGHILVDPRIAISTDRVEVQLHLSARESKAIRTGALLHAHCGTADVMASLALLGQNSLSPGGTCLAQLVFQTPVSTWVNDRWILRDASATRTLASATVLDPYGQKRYRQSPERMAYLEMLSQLSFASADSKHKLIEAAAHHSYGLSITAWLIAQGLTALPFTLDDTHLAVAHDKAQHGQSIVYDPQVLSQAAQKVTQVLAAYHAKKPNELGPDSNRCRLLAHPRMPHSVWLGFLLTLLNKGAIRERGGMLHLPSHGESLQKEEQVVAEKILPLLYEGRFNPPWVRDLAGTTRIPEAIVRNVLNRLAKTSEVEQIIKDLFYHPKVLLELAAIARKIAHHKGKITAGDFRDATSLGRKRAIEILEHFDKLGFLLRVGDEHFIQDDSHYTKVNRS